MQPQEAAKRKEGSRLKNIINKATNAAVNFWDYVRCCLSSKAARYQSTFLELETGDVGGKSVVNITMRPVIFAEGDIVEYLKNSEVVPQTNIVETDSTDTRIYDDKYSMVFLLDSRLYGGESGRDEASVIDTKKNRILQRDVMLRFLCHLVKKVSPTASVGWIRNAPPISYKEVAGIAAGACE